MPGRLRVVDVGPSAISALVEELERLQDGDPLAPVTVLTPTVRAAVHLRHAIADRRGANGQLGGIANVRFLSLALFADQLGSNELALSKEPLSRVVLAATIAAELEAHPGRFAPVQHHPSTLEVLSSAYEDLRYASPHRLDRLVSTSARSRELLQLFARVRERLRRCTYDDADVLVEASNAQSGPVDDADRRVIVHLPVKLNSLELGFLATLADRGEVTVVLPRVSGCFEPVADESTSSTSRDVVGLISEALAGVGFVASDDPCNNSAPAARRVVEAADPDLEVAMAMRLVLEALSAGHRLERIGVFYTRAEPYGSALANALRRAGVTWSGAAPARLAMTPSARFVDRLLGLYESGFGRGEVIAFALGSRLVDATGHLVDSADWDRCSRLAGIIGGESQMWTSKLARLEHQVATRRHASASTADGSLSLRDQRTLRACRELAGFVAEIERTFHRIKACRSWTELSDLLLEVVRRQLGEQQDTTRPTKQMSDEEEVTKLLFNLRLLDRLEVPLAINRVRSLVQLGGSGPAAHIGTLGSGLVVGSLDQAVGLDLDCAVVLGCSEQELNRVATRSVLISDSEFDILGLSEHTEKSRRLQKAHQLELALFGADEVIVSYSAGDFGQRASVARPPRLFAGEPVERAPGLTDGLRAIAGGTLIALDLDELERAALFVHTSSGRRASSHHLMGSSRLHVALEVAEELATRRFGTHAGRLALPGLGEHLSEAPFSPTRLEQYATCPFRYFASQLLGIEVLEDPELRLSIDPRDRGSIVHEVLERHVRELLATHADEELLDGDGPPKAAPGSPERLIQIAEEVFSRYEQRGLTGKRVLWELERQALLVAMLEEAKRDEARRKGGWVPIAVEHSFGVGELEPVAVELHGRQLKFRGYIDRVDKDKTGTVKVIDYKTGRIDPYRGLQNDPVDRGRRLQLPIYALAAKQAFGTTADLVESSYRFIDSGSVELPFVLDNESTARFEATLEILVDGITSGAFPYRPGEMSFGGQENCRFCDYAKLCPSDRALFWESARLDASVAPYSELSEATSPTRSAAPVNGSQ